MNYPPNPSIDKYSQALNSETESQPKSSKEIIKEWLSSFFFAATAALIIRAFFLEAFVIPTSSMERSLMVGDFLFVSKFHYGARMPMAPVSFPFVHNKLPFSHTPSYISAIQLPYFRLPGISSIERGEPVVFNYPADDIAPNDPLLGPVRIPSMKENYIKRCVGVPGDTLSVKDGFVYINGKQMEKPPKMQLRYYVETNQEGFNPEILKPMGFRNSGENKNYEGNGNHYVFHMPEDMANTFKQWSNVTKIERGLEKNVFVDIYPHEPQLYPWSLDYWGPYILPKRNMTIQISANNLPLYRRLIETYENNKVEIFGEEIKINDKPAKSYTFKMDYYFMMGDNRYNSLDSRYWGPVPEDHIIGKPIFVFFSTENGTIRWDRILMGIK